MNSQVKPEILGKSPMKDMPPSWKAEGKARLEKAIAQFKKDTAGKSWDDLADELEAKARS